MARAKDETSQAPAQVSATVDDSLQFESFVADVSARFVNLPADQVDAEIESAQRQIVEALGLDRSTLFELLPDGSTIVFTHYWARPGFPEPPKRVDVYEHFPWCAARFLRREICCTRASLSSHRIAPTSPACAALDRPPSSRCRWKSETRWSGS